MRKLTSKYSTTFKMKTISEALKGKCAVQATVGRSKVIFVEQRVAIAL
jgi:hypothetical protein